MDGLWKTLLKWMIWGYPYFLETPIWIDAFNGLSGIPMKPSATLTMRGFFLNAPQVQTSDSSERHPGWGSPVFNSPADEIETAIVFHGVKNDIQEDWSKVTGYLP